MKRIVKISYEPQPSNWDSVWIQCNEDVKPADAIKCAMRMRPDELIIDNSCFGLFGVS